MDIFERRQIAIEENCRYRTRWSDSTVQSLWLNDGTYMTLNIIVRHVNGKVKEFGYKELIGELTERQVQENLQHVMLSYIIKNRN